ncbi:hypothetical protein ACB092_01G236900 [Castanea dentata]
MAECKSLELHIAMFPWFAIGHMTPFLHLSNEIAKRGHKITFMLPKKAQIQLQHLNLHPNFITFHPLTIPHVDGLPLGAETTSDISISLVHLLAIAMDRTREQVENIFRAQTPDMVCYDNAHWIPEITKQLRIKSICYNVVSAASLAIAVVPTRNVPKDRAITKEELKQLPIGYPSSTIVLRNHEVDSLSFISLPFGEGITFYDRVTTAMKESDVISIRTCQEMEGQLCDYVGNQFGKSVLLTGPVLPEPTKSPSKGMWATWLDGFEPGSMVFCAFGSQIILEKKQFQELLLGFELIGLPFLIALKPPMECATVEEALPNGFKERVKERGRVFGGWVEQPLILSHPTIGCFVSHCGFGSMWESLMSNCQIVLVPHLGDQILNTRLLVEEMKVAVEVEREDNRWFSRQSLSKAIMSVMDKDNEVGIMVKKNHAKWKEILASPDFMSGYMDKFVQNLQDLVLVNKKA